MTKTRISSLPQCPKCKSSKASLVLDDNNMYYVICESCGFKTKPNHLIQNTVPDWFRGEHYEPLN